MQKTHKYVDGDQYSQVKSKFEDKPVFFRLTDVPVEDFQIVPVPLEGLEDDNYLTEGNKYISFKILDDGFAERFSLFCQNGSQENSYDSSTGTFRFKLLNSGQTVVDLKKEEDDLIECVYMKDKHHNLAPYNKGIAQLNMDFKERKVKLTVILCQMDELVSSRTMWVANQIAL